MSANQSAVIGKRLPAKSRKHRRRTASARLVEEGLRRSEFAFIDFRDSAAGRQACIQASSLAVWEVILLLRSHKGKVGAVARHLHWPQMKVTAAVSYAEAYPEEIDGALAENQAMDFVALKRMLPRADEVKLRQPARR